MKFAALAPITPGRPKNCGESEESRSIPEIAVSTGMFQRSATERKSSRAPAEMTPEPAMMTGRSAVRSFCERRNDVGRVEFRKRVLRGVVPRERFGFDLRRLNVKRNVEPDGTGASGHGEAAGAFEVIANFLRFFHSDGVFRDWADDVGDVELLIAELTQFEFRTGADHGFGFDLSGDDDHRDGIKPGSGDSGDGVGSAGGRW